MNSSDARQAIDWVIQYQVTPQILRPALFLDRDGTIIENVPYLSDPAKVVLIEGVVERIKAFRGRGFAIVIVTNQSGIARGLCTPDQYRAVEARVQALLGLGSIDATYACPFLPGGQGLYDVDHSWRKPSDGMLRAAAADLNLDLSRSIMVGDSFADMSAGARAGVACLVHVLSGHGEAERNIVAQTFGDEDPERSGHSLLLVDTLADLDPTRLPTHS